MKKYNEVVECYRNGMDNWEAIGAERRAEIEEMVHKMEDLMDGTFKVLTDELEEKVKNWTAEDYDHFIQLVENDVRMDDKGILTISAAYAKTHGENDGKACNNVVCREAMLKMALQTLGIDVSC